MKKYIKNLNLIDMISEKHAQLRRIVREEWVNRGESPISDTESYILALLQKEPLTVSQLARIIDISRQGAHKCVQGLITRGYVHVSDTNKDAKNKLLLLTEEGNLLCEKSLIVKREFEENIKNILGEQDFKLLKGILEKMYFE